MLSLGIPIDFDNAGNTIVDLNIGGELKAKDFPQDSEFQLLAFSPNAKTATVVWIQQLAEDIGEAIGMLEKHGFANRRKPDWYKRLSLCSSGATRKAPRA
jgi:hypothetical protein